MMNKRPTGYLRIGQIAALSGVDAARIRSWEARYGVPVADRTGGGQRRYSQDELERVFAMRDLIAEGYRASEAARMVASMASRSGREEVDRAGLLEMLIAGSPEAFTVLDAEAAASPIEDVIGGTLLPLLKGLGDGWAEGRYTVAEEHAASALVVSWLGAAFRSLPPPLRKDLIVTATPQGERHDIPLLMTAIHLRRQGAAVLHLGADVPADDLARIVTNRSATAVCLSTSTDQGAAGLADALARLAPLGMPVGLGGSWRPDDLPDWVIALPEDMKEAARLLLSLGPERRAG